MRIAVAGIGKMGAAIAARLIEVGHDVTVWNRTPGKAKAIAGATVAATPAELLRRSDIIISSLTDAAALDAVYKGPSGLLSGDVAGKLFIDMSTVLPATEVALAEAVRSKGAAFVECPVGGSTGPARQGKLIGLVGGDAADIARARPILEQLCRRLEHAGPVGSGAVLKFAVNLPLMVYWQALGEALALAHALPVAPERLMDLLERHLRRRHHRQSAGAGHRRNAQGRRSRSGDLRRRRRHQGHAGYAGGSQIARHRAAGCRQERSPVMRKPSATARAVREISTVSAYWASRGQQ